VFSIARTGREKQVWQQDKERKRKMTEHRNYKIRIENWTETKEFSTLFNALREAEREAKDRKLEAEISISIKLSKNDVTVY
jgi:hypothetical protein